MPEASGFQKVDRDYPYLAAFSETFPEIQHSAISMKVFSCFCNLLTVALRREKCTLDIIRRHPSRKNYYFLQKACNISIRAASSITNEDAKVAFIGSAVQQ